MHFAAAAAVGGLKTDLNLTAGNAFVAVAAVAGAAAVAGSFLHPLLAAVVRFVERKALLRQPHWGLD